MSTQRITAGQLEVEFENTAMTSADVNVFSTSGEVLAKGSSGNVDVNSTSGEVLCMGTSGEFNSHSTSGEVVIKSKKLSS